MWEEGEEEVEGRGDGVGVELLAMEFPLSHFLHRYLSRDLKICSQCQWKNGDVSVIFK